jgi:hypothetical protein
VNLKSITLAGGLCACLILGCARNDDPQASKASTQPASVSSDRGGAMVAATTPPAATQPSGSVLLVDRAQMFFPPALMRLSRKNGRVEVRLYSDDPSPDMADTQAINSYDLIMTMPPEIQSFSELPDRPWVNGSMTMEKQNTPYGIFLNNQRDILQPLNVTVQFFGQLPYMHVVISGTFARFQSGDDDLNSAPTPVRVRGVLQAAVVTSK